MAKTTNLWLTLLKGRRWAALGTIDQSGNPFVSGIAYAVSPSGGLLLHLSQLAAHTRHLGDHSNCSVLISEADVNDDRDPQELQRLTLQGEISEIERESDDFESDSRIYIDRFPASEMRFGFSDFHLFQFLPTRGNFVGGFGRAEKLSGERIREAMST